MNNDFVNILTSLQNRENEFNIFLLKVEQLLNEESQKLNNKLELNGLYNATSNFFKQNGLEIELKQSSENLKIHFKVSNRESNLLIDFLSKYLENKSFNTGVSEKQDSDSFNNIFLYLNKITESRSEDIDLRQIIRVALKKALNLSDRDGLFFKDVEPLIKKFDHELVRQNARLRELKKHSYEIELLSSNEKKLMDNFLKDEDLDLMLNEIVRNIVEINLDSMGISPIGLFSNFSFLFLKNLSDILKEKIESKVNIDLIHRYAIYIYREKKEVIFKTFAFEIFDLVSINNNKAKEFILIFDGKDKNINGYIIYFPKIVDSRQNVWEFSNIKDILTLQSGHNKIINDLRESMLNNKNTINKIDKELDSINKRIKGIESNINELNKSHENKREEFNNMEKLDIETRNAMTRVINKILQEKIALLDSISELNVKAHKLKESKTALIKDNALIKEQIQFKRTDDRTSTNVFRELVSIFASRIESVVLELDSNV